MKTYAITKAQIEQAIAAIIDIEQPVDDAVDMLQGLLEQEAQPVAIDWPVYHESAMGCGLEDRSEQNDAYAAMRYGWDCAIESVAAMFEKDAAWQPIETAPKDGTEAIVYTPAINGEDERYDFEKYVEDEGGWIVHANHYEHFCMIAKGGADCHWTGPSENPKYTHWMPLPKPPIDSAKQAKQGERHDG